MTPHSKHAKRPNGFYKEVQKYLNNVRLPKSTISMVKSGRRDNDAILLAIIEVDHKITHNL
jgi:hypothetical protein